MDNSYRVYIKPFDDYGAYSSWIDVTKDVERDSLGSISSDLDNTEFDIGVYRNSSFRLTFKNEHGKYSDVGSPQTIFRYTRSNSLVKVTWAIHADGTKLGMFKCGTRKISPEMVIFTGLLSDEGTVMDLDAQKVSFTILGRESRLQKAIVPYASLANGQNLSTVIYNCLNQAEITDLLTVSPSNISLGLDQAIDDVSVLETKTVQEALADLLLAGNSVLYVEDDAIKVAPRTATAAVQFTFFGQASPLGVENVQSIKGIRNGLAKTFNYISWRDTNTVSQDATSVAKYGARKKEVEFPFFTNGTKRQNILDALAAEFKNPKQEFELYSPITYKTLALGLLDRVAIDYPTVYYPQESPLPICGIAVCGEAVLPKVKWAFRLGTDQFFKIIGKSLDAKTSLFKFKLREI